jgi:hypothetical protein
MSASKARLPDVRMHIVMPAESGVAPFRYQPDKPDETLSCDCQANVTLSCEPLRTDGSDNHIGAGGPVEPTLRNTAHTRKE